jgi:tight adherence protein C
LMKVTQEVRITHPELSDELQLVNLEMRIGKTRIDALRELARRTGLEDIKSLVAMLVQTDRFGTSVAQSLRVFSDDLRIKRRQRAEEMSAKTSVKMVIPLVFFIFPALLAVILGPAVLTLLRQLVPALGR